MISASARFLRNSEIGHPLSYYFSANRQYHLLLTRGCYSAGCIQKHNRIESDAKVDFPRNVTLKAGSEILLEPPFEVALDATLVAEIESPFAGAIEKMTFHNCV